MSASTGSKPVAVVLVHGGFVDGSGWDGVYRILRDDGFTVAIVQNPTFAGRRRRSDEARDRRPARPVVLVGHSYGGVVITEAGRNPKVAGLVYIAAFAPDAGDRSLR